MFTHQPIGSPWRSACLGRLIAICAYPWLSAAAAEGPLPARFLRVESGSARSYLHFAEVEVYVDGRNIAVGKPVSASSSMGRFTPDLAVDGVVSYTWGPDASFWSSAHDQGNEWWELDLGAHVAVEKVVLHNRQDCCQERLHGAVLSLLGDNRNPLFRTTLSAGDSPFEHTFVEPRVAPVDLHARTLRERLDNIAPRFDRPSEDAADVMPVGSGDLSAMLRYDRAWEIHLSKTDFFGRPKNSYGGNLNILSPGTLRLDFGIVPETIRRFEQRLDLQRGTVVLTMETAAGPLRVEAYGAMGRNTLVFAVEDGRSERTVAAAFSVWRPEMAVTATGARLVARQVHANGEDGKTVADPGRVSPADRLYNLGVGVAAALVGEDGLLDAAAETGTDPSRPSATLRANPGPRYWLVVSAATSYDGAPETEAVTRLEQAVSDGRAGLLEEHLAWWERFWEHSYLDLHGRDAEYLMRLWHVTLYSYAAVGEGAALPKFNGGPGLVHEDDRHWGWGYWWQNTRLLIWPMLPASHLRYARDHLDFYNRTFADCRRQTAQRGKVGVRVWEGATPFKPGTVSPPPVASPFDAAALERAMADRRMEDAPSGYNSRSLAQAAELVQLMLEYVAFAGDSDYLGSVVAPWLKEASLFYLSYLKLEDDGLYHMTPADALEQWWKVKDPMTDLCAVRFCFWHVLNHGADFGYETEFIEAVRHRLDRLAPLPTGQWIRRSAREGELPAGRPAYVRTVVDAINRDANMLAPAADVLDDPGVYNMEHPELYAVFPFALVDANSSPSDLERAVNAFKARQHPNQAGWSQCGIQAARLRLPTAVDVIMDHARRQQKYPYGGWNNVAVPLKGSRLGVSDVPYFDSAGVNMTALQEALLQSHRLSTAEACDLLSGGPIVVLPAVRRDWAGRFRLRARGGFLVAVAFQPGPRVERIVVEAERGGTLRLANPFAVCQGTRNGQALPPNRDAVLVFPAAKGDVFVLAADPD